MITAAITATAAAATKEAKKFNGAWVKQLDKSTWVVRAYRADNPKAVDVTPIWM